MRDVISNIEQENELFVEGLCSKFGLEYCKGDSVSKT